MGTRSKTRDYGYTTKPPRDFADLHVMVCESEIQGYAERYPSLSAMQIRSILLAYGPRRKDVEEAMAAASRSMPI